MTLELHLRCEKEQHEKSWLGPGAPGSGSILCRGSELGRLDVVNYVSCFVWLGGLCPERLKFLIGGGKVP